MNERLQKKNCSNFLSFYDVKGEARRKIRFKSIMRCPRFVEKKRHTFTLFIKICFAEVRHNWHIWILIFEAMLNDTL